MDGQVLSGIVHHFVQGSLFFSAVTHDSLKRRDGHVPMDEYLGLIARQFVGIVRIALEIARQLRAQGDEVELLFLLDPMAPVHYAGRGSDQILKAPGFVRSPLRQRITDQIRALARAPRVEAPRALRRLAQRLRRWSIWQRAAYHLVDFYGRHPTSITRLLLPRNRWPAFWYAARRLARSYVALPYEGRCLAVFHDRAERYGIWSSLLSGDAELLLVESTHLGMWVSPTLEAWMDELENCCQAAA